MKLILEETFEVENVVELNESTNQKTYVIKGTFSTPDKKNRNGRIYASKLWEDNVSKYQAEIKGKTANTLMEKEHPPRTAVDPWSAVAQIRKLEMREGLVYGEAELLNIPETATMRALIDKGIKIGVSSRGVGKMKGDIVEEFNLITYDVVSTPSDYNANLEGFNESMILEGVDFSINEKGQYICTPEGCTMVAEKITEAKTPKWDIISQSWKDADQRYIDVQSDIVSDLKKIKKDGSNAKQVLDDENLGNRDFDIVKGKKVIVAIDDDIYESIYVFNEAGKKEIRKHDYDESCKCEECMNYTEKDADRADIKEGFTVTTKPATAKAIYKSVNKAIKEYKAMDAEKFDTEWHINMLEGVKDTIAEVTGTSRVDEDKTCGCKAKELAETFNAIAKGDTLSEAEQAELDLQEKYKDLFGYEYMSEGKFGKYGPDADSEVTSDSDFIAITKVVGQELTRGSVDQFVSKLGQSALDYWSTNRKALKKDVEKILKSYHGSIVESVINEMDAEDVEYYGQIINQAKKDKASSSDIKKALKKAGASKDEISDLSGMFEGLE